jgi:hypothetical protein
LSAAFKRAAVVDEVGALAYMFFSAFGISLTSCFTCVSKALIADDHKIMTLMMACAVQIRGNVNFISKEYAGIQNVYPELVIVGQADRPDILNFSALHVCGHLLSMITSNPLGKKALEKAGNCVTGEGCTPNDAGKINKEVADRWPSDERNGVLAEVSKVRTTHAAKVNAFFDQLTAANAKFAGSLTKA